MKPAIRQMGREQDRVQNIISCLHIRCNTNETHNLHVYRCTLRINILLIFAFCKLRRRVAADLVTCRRRCQVASFCSSLKLVALHPVTFHLLCVNVKNMENKVCPVASSQVIKITTATNESSTFH
jgi:hypothetical protein